MKQQQDAILRYFEQGNTLTAKTALEKLGIGGFTARISELRSMGYAIQDRRINVPSRWGGSNVKEYWLKIPNN